MKRYFAIGDIHGCVDELRRLLGIIPITKNDELIFLGDYVDRGPNSKGVIDFLIGLNGKYKKKFLRGNHEEMLLRAIQAVPEWGDRELWLSNGGWQTLQSYSGCDIGGDVKLPKEHYDFLSATLDHYETGKYIFVHAGMDQSIPIEGHPEDYLLWVRDEFIEDESDWPKKVIFGHTPQDDPLVMKNKIGIDTGCVFGGKLTCVELPDVNFYQVERSAT